VRLVVHEHATGLVAAKADLAGMLRDGAEVTEVDSATVVAAAADDPVLLADQAAGLDGATQREEARQEAVAKSALTALDGGNLLGDLARSTEPRHAENFAVREAIAQPRVPSTSRGHC